MFLCWRQFFFPGRFWLDTNNIYRLNEIRSLPTTLLQLEEL